VLLRLWPLTGDPALSGQFAAVAVTMDEHLRSDSAGGSAQIAESARFRWQAPGRGRRAR